MRNSCHSCHRFLNKGFSNTIYLFLRPFLGLSSTTPSTYARHPSFAAFPRPLGLIHPDMMTEMTRIAVGGVSGRLRVQGLSTIALAVLKATFVTGQSKRHTLPAGCRERKNT